MHTCSHTHTPGTCTHVHTVWAHSGTRRVVDDPVARPRSHTHTGHVYSPARSPAVSHLHLGGSGSGGTRRPSGKPRSRPQSPGAGACPEDIFPWSLREEGRSDLSPLCRDPRFWGGRRQPLSSPCPHLGLGRPEPRLLRRSLDPVPALERGELLRPRGGRKARLQAGTGSRATVPATEPEPAFVAGRPAPCSRSGRPGQACVPGELRPDTHAWTRSFLGCCPHMGLLETGLRTCAEHKSPGVMASAHSPPHPTLWTPHPGDGVWPLSHSPQGGESPQVSTLGTRAPTPALAPSGPASVPAGRQSWGGGSGGLPSPLEKSWVLTPSPSALQTRANTS